MGMGMQGTPAGNAMAGIAMPMPMMKGGYHMMDKMMMKGGDDMMMDKDMMDKDMMDNDMMDKDMMDKDMMDKDMMGGKKYSRKYMKGGMAYGGPLSPHTYDGRGVGTSGAGLQIMATTMS
jgi:hypothetical protein